MKRILIVSLALLFVLVPALPTLAQDEPVTLNILVESGGFQLQEEVAKQF